MVIFRDPNGPILNGPPGICPVRQMVSPPLNNNSSSIAMLACYLLGNNVPFGPSGSGWSSQFTLMTLKNVLRTWLSMWAPKLTCVVTQTGFWLSCRLPPWLSHLAVKSSSRRNWARGNSWQQNDSCTQTPSSISNALFLVHHPGCCSCESGYLAPAPSAAAAAAAAAASSSSRRWSSASVYAGSQTPQ